jgi:hypothetical protein
MKTKIVVPQQKTRDGALTLKQFYSLSTEEYNAYILSLFNVPAEDRTDVDKHIIKFHNFKPTVIVEEFFLDF